ncbi:Exocyst complex component 5 [Physocladia obscura]|uniref:Exocyst complex component 5 n=1 Tax=Physocladia obscura TaxID=109957 RepID=A0AAD5TC44_9FUNG|nr:Exocyst complex component 5 [Physocladia obscura]
MNYKEFRNYDSKTFIDQRTAAVASSPLKTSLVKQLEPKPLIAKFESTLDDLLRLRRKVQTKIDDLEDAAQASENARRRKLVEMNLAVEEVQSAFKSLEVHLGEVGKTAIRIGEQLETIDKQRRIAAEAKDLIYYFQDFNIKKDGALALDAFRKSGSTTEAQTAPIVRRLNAIAKEIGTVGTEMAKESIEKFSEELETSILHQFHTAYTKGDKEIMNKCAKVLTELNGGTSCVQTYINQHEFFINQAKVVSNGLFAEDDPIDKNSEVLLNPKLAKLFEEVKATIPQEWGIISSVFPNSVSVMQNFVQRVFAQSVQNYVEQELSVAVEVGDMYYLRTLRIVHEATLSVCKNLYKFDKSVIMVDTKSVGISAVLDRCFDDLFVPYTDNNRYVEVERRCLGNRFAERLANFNEFLVKKLENIFITYNNPRIQANRTLKHKQQAMPTFQTVGNILMGVTEKNSGSILNKTIAACPESVGLPSVSAMLEILEIHLEALERCKELSKLGDLARNVLAIFKVFIEECGEKYLVSALNMYDIRT